MKEAEVIALVKSLFKRERPNRYVIAAGLCTEVLKEHLRDADGTLQVSQCTPLILKLSQCLMYIPLNVAVDLSGLPIPVGCESYRDCPRDEWSAHLVRLVLENAPNNTEALYRLATLISRGVKISVGDLAMAHFQGAFTDRLGLEAALYKRILEINPQHKQAVFKLKCLETTPPILSEQSTQSTEGIQPTLLNKHKADSYWGVLAQSYTEKANYFFGSPRCDRYIIAAGLYAESIRNRLTLEAMLGLHECFKYIPPCVDIDLTILPLPKGCRTYDECSRIKFMENLFTLALQEVAPRDKPRLVQVLNELKEKPEQSEQSEQSVFAKSWF